MQTKTIHQKNLSSECWSVQAWGTDYCKKCEYKGTKECGGKKILKTGKNELGQTIPVN